MARLPGDPGLPPGCSQRDCDGLAELAADMARAISPVEVLRLSQSATIRGDREITKEEVAAIIDESAGFAHIAAECAALIIANCDSRHAATATLNHLRGFLDLHYWRRA